MRCRWCTRFIAPGLVIMMVMVVAVVVVMILVHWGVYVFVEHLACDSPCFFGIGTSHGRNGVGVHVGDRNGCCYIVLKQPKHLHLVHACSGDEAGYCKSTHAHYHS